MKNGARIACLATAVWAFGLAMGQWQTRFATEARQRGESQASLTRPAMADLSDRLRVGCEVSSRDARDIVYLLACSKLEAAVSIPASASAACRLVADTDISVQDAVMRVLGLEAGKSDYLLNCEKI